MQGLEHHQLTNLVTLELRGNCLETTDGIYLPNLRNLYLVCLVGTLLQVNLPVGIISKDLQYHLALSLQAKNKIKRLEGLEGLEQLNTLHLRDNQLESLDGINMKRLQYLNIR